MTASIEGPQGPDPIATEPRRSRRRRLTIRTSMVGILLLALVLGGFGEARRQYAGWSLVESLGNPSFRDEARARVDRFHAERTAASWLASYLNETRKGRKVTAARTTPSFNEVEAYRILERFGPDAQPAVPELVRALHDEPSVVLRIQAVRLLGRFAPEDDRAFEALRDVLNAPTRADLESDEFVSRAAAREVGALRTRAGVLLPLLIANLNRGGEPRERSALALEMMGTGAEPAIPALLACLDDPNPSTRASAGMVLVNIGPLDGPIADRLARLENDPDEFVRSRIGEAKVYLNYRREVARNTAEQRRLIAYDRSLGGRPRPPGYSVPPPKKEGEGVQERPDTPR